MSDDAVGVIAGIIGMALLVVLWVVPVVLGVRWAKRKGLSPHWMWFGVHPLTGWIAFWIIRYRAANRGCPACGKSVPSASKFCPHCKAPQVTSDADVGRQIRWWRNQVACPKCRAWVRLGSSFCPSCSAPTPVILCPRCGSDKTVLAGGRTALVNGIVGLLIAGSFYNQLDQSLERSQIFQYTKSIWRALTGEMLIYLVGAGIFAALGAWSLFGATGTMLKRIACQQCGAKSSVPAAPRLAVGGTPAVE